MTGGQDHTIYKKPKKMAIELGAEAYIAVIEESEHDNVCVEEIEQEDF